MYCLTIYLFYTFDFYLKSNSSVISLTSWLTPIPNGMNKTLRTLITLSFLSIKIRIIRTFDTISPIPQRPIYRTNTLISLWIVYRLCQTLTTFCTWIEHSWQCATYCYRLYSNGVEYGLLLGLAVFIEWLVWWCAGVICPQAVW